MKDPRDVLNRKMDEMNGKAEEMKKLQLEINALRAVVPMLVEETDRSVETRAAISAGAKAWP